MNHKYATILGNLGNTSDRFLSVGYRDLTSKEELIRQAASIPEVSGIELVGTWDIEARNVTQIAALLKEHRLRCAAIIPDHFSQKIWSKGAFTSRVPHVRQQAVAYTKEMLDIAAELDCSLINLWPGQDGYDYPFQGDFQRAYDWLVAAIRECADYRKDTKISLEYKLKEPRTHSYLARAADTLVLVQEINRENVGVTIDFGHALMAQENVAESAVMLARTGKLFHLHFNDNYRYWDDDMVVGSIHTIEYLELLFWLRQMNYQGWFSMDLYPYREDAREAVSESIEWLKTLEALIDQAGMAKIEALIQEGNAIKTIREMRKLMLGKSNG